MKLAVCLPDTQDDAPSIPIKLTRVGVTGVKKLLQLENRPTAIFVASDHMAIASMAAIHSSGLRIPQDISVIAISDIAESAYLTPPLTTVSIPQKEMGKIATEILLQRINGDSTITKQVFVPCKLTIRNSVKKIN